VPLTKIQSELLLVLARFRNPESYVAGGTPLNLRRGRFSSDIDLFHDREERVADAAAVDAMALTEAGFQVSWLRRQPQIHTASVEGPSGKTRLEWVVDSDYRFFPVVPDATFGYVLHPVDLGTNKVMAAAGRREVRDLVDLSTIHESILPLGAVVWAAVDKSPGFTPESLIGEIRRNSIHPAAEWRALSSDRPINPADELVKLRLALDQAEEFVSRMPTELEGLLFLEGDRIVQPDTSRLRDYTTHRAVRRGHWPGNSEVWSAMLEWY
jgi:hypothetical protein